MLPHKHVLISLAAGAAGWRLTGERGAVIAAVVAGVLPDLDHIVDYAYYSLRGDHKLILLLHGYEYVLLGAAIALSTNNRSLGVALFSYLVHLAVDQMENRTYWWGYSLLLRAYHKFRIEDISTVPVAAMQGRIDDMQRLGGLFAR